MSNKYVEKLSHYTTEIPPRLFEELSRAILENRPLTPEVVGFLMGGARPTNARVLCLRCKKEILVSHDFNNEYELGFKSNYRPGYNHLHKQCAADLRDELLTEE